MPDFIFRLPLQLTDAQRIAIDGYEESLVVTGGPGSGKTTVTIYRFLTPIINNQDALLFTYNRTLLASVKGILRSKGSELFPNLDANAIESLLENQINSFYEWYGWFDKDYDEEIIGTNFTKKIASRDGKKYSEIFIDEGQDLTPSVFAKVSLLADKVTCGADNAQDLQSNFPPDEALSVILRKLRDQIHTDLQPLEQNFRNTREIFALARKFVPDDENVQNLDINELPTGENPEILNNLSIVSQLAKIKEIIEINPTSNIGILVNYRNQVRDIKIYFEENGYSCQRNSSPEKAFSYYCSGMNYAEERVMFDQMKTPFICTYDSCKGLEFDIVIMPFFNDAERALSKSRRNHDTKVEERNADGSIKMWATRNHYYVGATRARTLLYIMCDTIPEILKFNTINN